MTEIASLGSAQSAHTETLGGWATSRANASCRSTPTTGIAIQGNTMRVDVALRDLPVAPSAFDGVVGFTIESDTACGSGPVVRVVG